MDHARMIHFTSREVSEGVIDEHDLPVQIVVSDGRTVRVGLS